MFDEFNDINPYNKIDYTQFHGDGKGGGGGFINGLLGKMTDQEGLFQGGQKNRLFGRLRDAFEGTSSDGSDDPTSSNYETTATNINTGNDFDPDNVQPGQNRFANSNDENSSVEREYPSWHPLHPNNAVSEGNVDNGVVKPGQNIFAQNAEDDGTNEFVKPGQNIFDRGLGEGTEEGDGSSVFDYNKPQYNETSYTEPQYNNKPFDNKNLKNSNYPYNMQQSLMGLMPGFNTVSNWSNYANTNPSKVDNEINDNQQKVFNSTRGNNLGGY